MVQAAEVVHGLTVAPWRRGEGFDCGKRQTIEYIIRLAHAWLLDFRIGQVQQYGNSAKILLGDIAPEGGAASPLGQEMIRRKWHKSHNSGVDFDIYVIRKDGTPAPSHIGDEDNPKSGYVGTYDRERTTILAKLIYRIARPGEIERVFFDDKQVIDALRPLGVSSMGPDPGRPANPQTGAPPMPGTPHRDHFHIRLAGGTYY